MPAAAVARIRPGVIQAAHLPAMIGGLNAVNAAGAMPPTDCASLVNMLAAEYGLRSRLGHREWAIGLTGAADEQVRTIIPFHGSTANKDRLFAVTSSGIWSATSTGSVTTVYAAATAYAVDAFVTANATTFGCKTAGTSHASAGLPSIWAGTTAYVIGDRVLNSDNVYICTTGGTSAGAGGPSGETTGITDGTVVWDYQSADTAITDGTVVWTHQGSNVAPALADTFSTTSGDAGYGIFTECINAAGAHFGIYCDEANGFRIYTESTDTWAAGGITTDAAETNGPANGPADLVFPIVFKSRIWFVEKNTARAWYMATGPAISGNATKFYFGHRFTAGGYLVGLWAWNFSGAGSGPDDLLVAVSSGGDVLIYQMSDPADPTTTKIKAQVNLGGLPKYRRIATDFGGDLLFLTKTGIVPLSRLVAGVIENDETSKTSFKISNLFNRTMVEKSALHGWSIVRHPEDNALIVTYPTTDGANTQQFAQAQATKGWSIYEDLPMFSSAVWGGKLYFGTADGRVCVNDGYVDGRILADSSAFTDITFQVIPGFSGDGRTIQGQECRTHWLVDGGAVAFNIAARYDFDLTPADAPGASSSGSGGWDSGTWDGTTWGGDYAAVGYLRGLTGMGHHLSVAIKGKARSRTVLVGIDLRFTLGGD
jgi:hypothetical protein